MTTSTGRLRFVAAAWIAVLLVGATVSSSAGETTGKRAWLAASWPQAVPLSVSSAKTPRIRNPNVRTTGNYPQVSLSGVDLRVVNAAIRQTILGSERRFSARVPDKKVAAVPGLYKTSTERRLVSASTVVVSALVPTVELYFGGNDGSRWLSVTLQVATVRRVAIGELFAPRSQGLRALAAAARKQLAGIDGCVRRSIADPTSSFSHGFDPLTNNYQHFALLPGGLAIGFPLGQVGAPICGRVMVTVPYSVVRPYLSRLGLELTRGVRKPR